MSKEKQIKEMTNVIDKSHWKIEQDFTGCHINSAEIAEALYKAGYRKPCGVDWHREAEPNAQRIMELEVELEAMRGAANSYKMHYEGLAKEIFAEIEECLHGTNILYTSDLVKLKKKYTDVLDINVEKQRKEDEGK